MLREALVSRPNAGPPSSDPLNQYQFTIFQYFDGIFSILHRSVPIMLNYGAPFFSILGYSFSILPLKILKNQYTWRHCKCMPLYDLLLAVKKEVLTSSSLCCRSYHVKGHHNPKIHPQNSTPKFESASMHRPGAGPIFTYKRGSMLLTNHC